MNLKGQRRILVAFLFSMLCTILFFSYRIAYFIPTLILVIYKKDRHQCLWYAFLAGLILDLFSPNWHLGLYALNFCLTIWILYPLKKHFYIEQIYTIPIMTAIFSVLSTLFQILLLDIFGDTIPITFELIISDFILMPGIDAIFALLFFTLNPYLLQRQPKREYFME